MRLSLSATSSQVKNTITLCTTVSITTVIFFIVISNNIEFEEHLS